MDTNFSNLETPAIDSIHYEELQKLVKEQEVIIRFLKRELQRVVDEYSKETKSRTER